MTKILALMVLSVGSPAYAAYEFAGYHTNNDINLLSIAGVGLICMIAYVLGTALAHSLGWIKDLSDGTFGWISIFGAVILMAMFPQIIGFACLAIVVGVLLWLFSSKK